MLRRQGPIGSGGSIVVGSSASDKLGQVPVSKRVRVANRVFRVFRICSNMLAPQNHVSKTDKPIRRMNTLSKMNSTTLFTDRLIDAVRGQRRMMEGEMGIYRGLGSGI